MIRPVPNPADPLEADIELALAPGSYIHDRAIFSFVASLEQVSDRILRLIQSHPVRACELYLTFLYGCYEKADEVDDSSNYFGGFAQSLICRWIDARQHSGADPQ